MCGDNPCSTPRANHARKARQEYGIAPYCRLPDDGSGDRRLASATLTVVGRGLKELRKLRCSSSPHVFLQTHTHRHDLTTDSPIRLFVNIIFRPHRPDIPPCCLHPPTASTHSHPLSLPLGILESCTSFAQSPCNCTTSGPRPPPRLSSAARPAPAGSSPSTSAPRLASRRCRRRRRHPAQSDSRGKIQKKGLFHITIAAAYKTPSTWDRHNPWVAAQKKCSPHVPNKFTRRCRKAPKLPNKSRTRVQQLSNDCSGRRDWSQVRPIMADVGQLFARGGAGFGQSWPESASLTNIDQYLSSLVKLGRHRQTFESARLGRIC